MARSRGAPYIVWSQNKVYNMFLSGVRLAVQSLGAESETAFLMVKDLATKVVPTYIPELLYGAVRYSPQLHNGDLVLWYTKPPLNAFTGWCDG